MKLDKMVTAKSSTSNQNLMGALAYLLGFVTGIVLLLVEKENNHKYYMSDSPKFCIE